MLLGQHCRSLLEDVEEELRDYLMAEEWDSDNCIIADMNL
jgi:hypothetical protein